MGRIEADYLADKLLWLTNGPESKGSFGVSLIDIAAVLEICGNSGDISQICIDGYRDEMNRQESTTATIYVSEIQQDIENFSTDSSEENLQHILKKTEYFCDRYSTDRELCYSEATRSVISLMRELDGNEYGNNPTGYLINNGTINPYFSANSCVGDETEHCNATHTACHTTCEEEVEVRVYAREYFADTTSQVRQDAERYLLRLGNDSFYGPERFCSIYSTPGQQQFCEDTVVNWLIEQIAAMIM